MKLTLTPSSAAVSWFSDVARIARPILVFSIRNHMEIISAKATTMMKIWTELMVRSPNR